MMKKLICSIHNAPPLTKVSFGHKAVQIADLENLHHLSAKLKQINWIRLGLCIDDTISNTIIHPAPNLVYFSLLNATSMDLIEDGNDRSIRFSYAICIWISYVGLKYSSLQKLELNSNSEIVHIHSNQIIEPLATALSKLTDLKAT
jgi:hypothetical protein